MEIEKNKYGNWKKREIILIFSPPIFNDFNFSKEEADLVDLPDIINNRKNLFFHQKEEEKSISWTNLYQKDYSEKLVNFLSKIPFERQKSPLIIFNYPRNDKQLISFINFAKTENSEKIRIKIFIVNSSSNIFKKLIERYVICPLCEKIYQKGENVDFFCPKDKAFFAKNELERFTDYHNNYFLENIVPVIKFFSENNNEIFSITANNEEEIMELSSKIMKTIKQVKTK